MTQDTKPASGSPKAYRNFFFFTVIAGFLGSAFQIFLYLTEYDWNVGMYRAGSSVVNAFLIFCAVSVGIILLMPLLLKPRRDPILRPRTDTALLMTSFLSGFILIAVFVLRMAAGGQMTGAGAAGKLFSVASLILIFPASAFFLVPIIRRPSEKVVTALAFFPVLWCGAFLMTVFFDRSCALSSPIRVLTQLSLIATMLYFLSELRFRIGKPKTTLYFMCANLAILLSFLSAVPLITLSFIQGWVVTNDVLYSSVQFCFLTYFLARVISMLKAEPDLQKPAA